MLLLAALFSSLALAQTSSRRALFWLVPYVNSTTSDYLRYWAQLAGPSARAGHTFAASMYALKANNASLGYATTPAGEAENGYEMEVFGLPALRQLNVSRIYGMVYVTHAAAIARMLTNPAPFISQLLQKAEEQNLAGFDVDYEPQGEDGAPAPLGPVQGAAFMAFLASLAAGLHAAGRELSIDVGGCPASADFVCAGLADPAALPGLVQVNTMDSFGVASVGALEALHDEDGDPSAGLGQRWAPGFEPAASGEAAMRSCMAFLGSAAACGPCVGYVSTWAVHEWNAGPQPQWLFDAVNSFVDAPLLE